MNVITVECEILKRNVTITHGQWADAILDRMEDVWLKDERSEGEWTIFRFALHTALINTTDAIQIIIQGKIIESDFWKHYMCYQNDVEEESSCIIHRK